MFRRLLRTVPGFRTATRWKAGLAIVGYGGLILWEAAAFSDGYLSLAFLGLALLAVLLVALNAWHLRGRLPGLRSSNYVRAALAWALVVALGFSGSVVASAFDYGHAREQENAQAAARQAAAATSGSPSAGPIAGVGGSSSAAPASGPAAGSRTSALDPVSPPSGATAPTAPTPLATPTAARPASTPSCQMTPDGLPDPVCTPGAAYVAVTQDNISQTICVSGYTTTIRPPTSYTDPLKVQQMSQYGFTGTTADYEEDHLIPLEVGGDPRDAHNLWPEPYNLAHGAHQKDTVENYLHSLVCAGRMTLSEAQREVATNWIAVYLSVSGSGATPPPVSTTPVPTSAPPTTPAPVGQSLFVTFINSGWGAVSVSAAPGASCNLQVRFPSGSLSTAQGVQVTVTVGSTGMASWSYVTQSNTKSGTGTNTVTCTLAGQTAGASVSFTVP
jgi:hypothetical protein